MKDPLLGEYTIEELMSEFLMDAIEKDPNQAFPRLRDGQVLKVISGDEWFDKLDDRVTKGEDPSLEDFLDKESADAVKKALTAPNKVELPTTFEDIKDDYAERG